MLVIPGRPGTSSLTWWILSEQGHAPQVTLTAGPGAPGAQVTVRPLKDAGEPAIADNIFLAGTAGLQPDAAYTIQVAAAGRTATGKSRTLPAAWPAGRPFTIALGSCYCRAMDRRL